MLVFILLFSMTSTKAQINKPSLSPRIVKEQMVGFAKLKLDYGQANRQGRQIFGGLIPYDKIWRTGANSSTKITFDKALQFAGNNVEAGTYALYTIPNPEKWTIILSNNSKLWGSAGYKEEDDYIRFEIPKVELKDTLETFTIYLENFHYNGADMLIAWENTKIKIPLSMDADREIFEEIENKIINNKGEINAQTYFDAAQFYYHKNKDLDKAVLWFDKAIELRPGAFWYTYYRAELAYQLQDNKTAKRLSEKCLKAANASISDYGYIGKCNLLLQKIAKN